MHEEDQGGQVRDAGSQISGKDLFIEVSANKKRVYEQEPILLTYKVYTLLELTQLEGKMPDLTGFHTQEVKLPQQKSFHIEQKNGRNYRCQRIAVDAIALITNPANDIDVLSKSEVAQILTGEISDWGQIEPSKLGKIQVVFEDNGASTVQYMRDSLMNGRPFAENVHAQGSSQKVFEAVQQNKNALGIIGVSWISADMATREMTKEERIAALEQQTTTQTSFSEGVNVLKIRYDNDPVGHQPYQAYIDDGSYPFFRSVYMISSGANGSLSHGFFTFVTSVIGQKIIQQTGIMPAAIQPRIVELI